MKYFLTILAICVLFCACSGSTKKDKGHYSYKENGVLEEEFDLLIAPQMDYEEDIPYEEQIKAIQKTAPKTTVKLAQPKSKKPQKKPIALKID